MLDRFDRNLFMRMYNWILGLLNGLAHFLKLIFILTDDSMIMLVNNVYLNN